MGNDLEIYSEKQHLGFNRLSMIWRTLITLFCFISYYWSENPKPVQVAIIRIGQYPVSDIPNSGQIFFMLGISMLVLSTMLVYILHTNIKVYNTYIVIDGFWTARRVKINLDTITHLRKSKYKKHIFRRAVYNLHSNGIIRFYTSGNEFIELKDNTGFTYRIGTQRASELYRILKAQLKEIEKIKELN